MANSIATTFNNTNLVFLSKDNVPLTTSLVIAQAVGYNHRNVLALIKKYLDDLQKDNPVTFKKSLGKPLPQGGYAQSTEFAYLDERQATILICFMQNNERVKQFKVALVDAFISMKKALSAQTGVYTPEQIAEIKNNARKQGYAIAMNYQSKKKESLTPEQIKEIKDVLGFYNDSRKASMSLMRELSDTVKLLLDVKEHLNILGHGYIVTHSRINEALANLKSE